jgi:hypothetical protein
MNFNEFSQAIYKLNPQVAIIRGDIAYDAQGNEVTYDIQAVTAQAEADAQAAATAKASAIAKLSALGLTADEIAHLIP